MLLSPNSGSWALAHWAPHVWPQPLVHMQTRGGDTKQQPRQKAGTLPKASIWLVSRLLSRPVGEGSPVGNWAWRLGQDQSRGTEGFWSGPHLRMGQQALGVPLRHVAPGGRVCSGSWHIHPTVGQWVSRNSCTPLGPTPSALGTTGHNAPFWADAGLRPMSGDTGSTPTPQPTPGDKLGFYRGHHRMH